MHRLKQQMKPFFCFSHVASKRKIASLCGGTITSPVPLSFLGTLGLSVPLKGLSTALEGVMFPSHRSCCAFPLSLSVFSGPFPSKRSQAPPRPGPCHCIRADTNQRTWNVSEHNTPVSPAGHFQAMPRAGKRCSAGKLIFCAASLLQ